MSKFLEDMFIDVRDKPNKNVGLQSLMEMVEQAMDATTFLNEREMLQKGEEKGEYFLPTIRITEAWGQPGTKDRENIVSPQDFFLDALDRCTTPTLSLSYTARTTQDTTCLNFQHQTSGPGQDHMGSILAEYQHEPSHM